MSVQGERDPGSWWWLSFATDDGFLGAAIVGPVAHIGIAATIAHALDINPGGEVLGLEIPDEVLARIPADRRERLLTKEQAIELDAMLMAAADEERMTEDERLAAQAAAIDAAKVIESP